MMDATQPRFAKGRKLGIGFVAAALLALLAFAPFASAAPDPVGSGSTAVTFKQGFVKSLKERDVKIVKISPAKLKGKKATFPVTGGQLDPTTGAGEITHGGGLKFKAGKRTAPVKALVLDTTKKALFAKIAGKKVKFASVAGWSYVRSGFGVNLTIKKLKLTNTAAKQLNKKLGFKTKPKPFVGNRLIASGASETQPLTVTVLPGGNATLATDASTAAKLAKVKVELKPVSPATQLSPLPPTYAFPITGGNIAPAANAGLLESAGGVVLFQKLQTGPSTYLETEITLNAFFVDLAAKTVLVESVTKSNASEKLNVGSLGRSSIAELNLTGATLVSDPNTRTITAQNVGTILQPLAAEFLDAFVKIYEEYEKGGGPPVSPEHIKPGDPLGTLSFSVQTQ